MADPSVVFEPMTDQSPVVTVIMPTYGNRGFLAESVRSVLDQTFTDFELLIVDDCSREPIEVGSDDPRIRVLRHVRNQGPAAARNTALAHACGRYISFLDDDDLYPLDRLQRGVDEIGEARFHCVPITTSDRRFDGDLRGSMAAMVIPLLQQVMLRREDCLQFDPSLRTSEDGEWWLRMQDRAVFHWSEGEPVWYRLDDEPRPGVDLDVRLRDRESVAGRHLHWMDRPARAHRYAMLAYTALVAGRRLKALRYSLLQFRNGPSLTAVKLAARALTIGTDDEDARRRRRSASRRSE